MSTQEKVYTCELQDLPARPTLSERTRTPVQDLPQVFGRVYGKIMEYVESIGPGLPLEAYAVYCNMDMQDLDIEIGFTLSRGVPGRAEVQAGSIPAGRYAACLHVGPYDAIELAYTALSDWIAAQGLKATGVVYEFYLNGPGQVSSPDEYQTLVQFLLE